ncbi:hypothetical protein GCM10010517_36670 [Streptosporangium fragile]|uniref:HNH endonuclease n=1 Tax=Streptosporangium fragile TaxID=46186 RepID=A0ABN3VY97_9ACTN
MNGKQARRRRALWREQLEARLAQAQTATPRQVGTVGDSEVWEVGPFLMAIPTLFDDYPAAIKHAISRRRRAALHGHCDCGAERRIVNPHTVAIDHANDCPAGDDQLDALAAQHGLTVRRLT